MAESIKLTPARRRALAVLAFLDKAGPWGVAARVSNQTDLAAGTVYWQCADWLEKQGLATTDLDLSGDQCIRITDRGRQVVAADA